MIFNEDEISKQQIEFFVDSVPKNHVRMVLFTGNLILLFTIGMN